MNPKIPSTTLVKFTPFGDLLRFLRRRAGLTQIDILLPVAGESVGWGAGSVLLEHPGTWLVGVDTDWARAAIASGEIKSQPEAPPFSTHGRSP